jgi:hypothetical protein
LQVQVVKQKTVFTPPQGAHLFRQLHVKVGHWKEYTEQSSQVWLQKVVTPSQVTCPCSSDAQSRSEFEQVLLPLQLMVPDPQFAEAVQKAFPSRLVDGCLVAGVGAGVARVARKA